MMKNKGNIVGVALLVLGLVLPGCTEPGETTGVGAATGGVLGAGLGAIIGNQTGSTGSGLAIGAVAGASAGAAVGNALEAQQESIRTQDEAIERQEKTLQAQSAEIEELRRGYASDTQSARPPGYHRDTGDRLSERGTSPASGASDPRSARFAEQPAREPVRGSYGWQENAPIRSPSSSQVDAARVNQPAALTPQCQNAQDEITRASQSGEVSEKLFHYRRALRLCPDNPSFHNGLGELYLSMNRRNDAEYEFREALRLDPNYAIARDNLNSLGR